MVAEPSVITVDENDIIHVSSGGRLVAWDLAPDPMNPGFDKFTAQACFPNDCVSFNAVGNGTAIVSSVAPSVANILGDFNADGTVDAADYPLWRKFLGAPDESMISNNGDGANGVDEGDYLLWKASFGEPGAGGSGSGQVPEPSSIGLLILGFIEFLRSVRSRR